MQDVLSTAELPDPSIVPQQINTISHYVLSSDTVPSKGEVMKFYIGLRLLGDEKTKRLLAYIHVLLQEQEQKEQYDEF